MSQQKLKYSCLLAAVTALCVLSEGAYAQAFPSRPIRIVVPFPPGGTSDILARSIGQKLTEEWGQPVLADNRPGAAGNIASEIVAKSKPDGVTFASSGTGTSPHMSAELFKLMTGVKMLHVPYKGSTAAHPDLFAGRVNVMFDTLIATLPHIKGGRLKVLGITSKTRSAELPDAIPIAETVPGYESTSWVVMMGPAKIPAPVVEKLNAESVRLLALPDVKERVARLGAVPVGNSAAEARKFIHAELAKWTKTVKAAGITSGN
jgi:tripartite-type tricarboxylate transporter receptor subunit TctC